MLMTKKNIRQEMLSKRQRFDPEELRKNSRIIQQHILELKEWQTAARILLYMPIKKEVETDLLLEMAVKAKKTILLPRCRKDRAGMMDLAEYNGAEELIEGIFGIPEPDPATCKLVHPQEWNLDLAIIPGIAFDRRGYRVGYGGGYFDRFMAVFAEQGKGKSIGVAFSFQITDNLPADQWDTPMNMVCTEEGVLPI